MREGTSRGTRKTQHLLYMYSIQLAQKNQVLYIKGLHGRKRLSECCCSVPRALELFPSGLEKIQHPLNMYIVQEALPFQFSNNKALWTVCSYPGLVLVLALPSREVGHGHRDTSKIVRYRNEQAF